MLEVIKIFLALLEADVAIDAVNHTFGNRAARLQRLHQCRKRIFRFAGDDVIDPLEYAEILEAHFRVEIRSTK